MDLLIFNTKKNILKMCVRTLACWLHYSILKKLTSKLFQDITLYSTQKPSYIQWNQNSVIMIDKEKNT